MGHLRPEASGLRETLVGLRDVTTAAPADRQLLRYQASTGKFIYKDPSFIDVTDFGAVGDSRAFYNITIASGTTALTINGTLQTFAPADVGKTVWVPGAGVSGGMLVATILSIDGTTKIATLDTAASTTTAGSSEAVVVYTDDTAAILAAWSFAGLPESIHFPAKSGRNAYAYSGTGLTAVSTATRHFLRISGDVRDQTKIALGPNSYLLNYTNNIQGHDIGDFSTIGGKGIVKVVIGINNVFGQMLLHDFDFIGYHEIGYGFESPNTPLFKIRNGRFRAANSISTIGVALPKAQAGTSLEDLDFERNRIHVKGRMGGTGQKFHRCTFLNWDTVNTGGPRIRVWSVPDADPVNSGVGFSMVDVKFGNEFMAAGDLDVAFADELGTGTWLGDKMPDLVNDSAGYIDGPRFDDGMTWSRDTTNPSTPLIYSKTPNIRNLRVAGQLLGTPPSMVVQIDTAATPGVDKARTTSVFGPFRTDGLIGDVTPGLKVSNVAGLGRTIDPNGVFEQTAAQGISHPGGADPSGVKILLDAGLATWTSTVGTSTTAATDSQGGTDARNVTLSGTSVFRKALTTPVAGLQGWVEFDLTQPDAGTPQTLVYVQLRYSSSGSIHRRWQVAPRATGESQRFRLPFVLLETGGAASINLEFTTPTGVTAGSFKLGRVRVYNSVEPLNLDGHFARFTLPAVDALPAASSEQRGRSYLLRGGAGFTDTVNTCIKNAADAYVWTTL